ncbi:CRE-DHHC-1 protein [Aphelenchoides avenae]|nr:CRE-DHHC-1 protein [Aphelenchus avenae]
MEGYPTTSSNPLSNLSKRGMSEAVEATKKYSQRLQTQDILSIFVVLVVLPLTFLFEVTYVLSFWHVILSKEWWLRVGPLLYLSFNVYANLYKVVRVGPNGSKHSDLPSITKPGYHYCHSCHLNCPPRAYHCPSCDKCAFRRDHHCSFGAVCVGHFNQRYFVAAVVNLWFIVGTCVVWNWYLLKFALPEMSILQCWQLMLPHVALMLGFLSLFQFVSTFCLVSSLTILLFVSYLVAAQVFTFVRGQTRVEYLLDIHAYNLGFWENIKQALGSRWPLIFISPFFNSPLQSDGLSYRTRETESVSKDTKFM